MRRLEAALAIAALLAALACGRSSRPGDTGYVGTWSRGNDRAVSIIAITRVGDAYKFRWTKRSILPDRTPKLEVTCDWDGSCVETLNGEEQATYTFRAWVDPDTGHLMVEGHELRFVPERLEVRYVDELVVEPGGQVLWSYTRERNGQVFAEYGRPQRSFTKVSDGVAYPPL